MTRIATLITLLLCAANAYARDAVGTMPAEPVAAEATNVDADAEPRARNDLRAVVVDVKGAVRKMTPTPNGQPGPWQPVHKGDELTELTVISTGFRSEAVVRFGQRGQMIVKSGSKVGIRELRRKGDLEYSRMGLKYGRMQMDVDSSRGPNDARVVTPTGTLAIRGSGAQIGSSERGLGLQVQKGNWRVASGKRERNIVPGETTDSQLTPPIIIKQQKHHTPLGDVFGLTSTEHRNLLQNPPILNPNTPAGGRPVDQTIIPIEPPSSDRPSDNHIIIGG